MQATTKKRVSNHFLISSLSAHNILINYIQDLFLISAYIFLQTKFLFVSEDADDDEDDGEDPFRFTEI